MHPQRANIPLQCLDTVDVDKQWEPYQVPTAKSEPFISATSPVVDFHGWKKHFGKADQLTVTGGGSEYAQLFSVAISWGNKMNFSLYANMSSFCSDSHICCSCTV